MKTAAIALTVLISVGHSFAQDVRIVGGRAVDLQPVHTWFGTHKGERPMAHWKQIKVTQIKNPIATWDDCFIQTEDGATTEILLAHCDPSVRSSFAALSGADSRITFLESQINADHAQLAAPYQKGAIAVQRARSAVSAQLATLQGEYSTLTNQRAKIFLAHVESARQVNLLAMFTGQRYSGLEVWDCGLKR